MEIERVCRKWNIAAAAVLIVIGICSLCGPSRAQGADEVGKRKVTVNFENETFLTALQIVCHAANVKYKVDSAILVEDSRMVMSMTEVPFETALNSVLRSARPQGKRLTYRVNRGVYEIIFEDPEIARKAEHRVTVSANNEDVHDVLKKAFEQAGTKYEIDKAVSGTVTVSLKDTPLLNVGLQQIVRGAQTSVPITFRHDRDKDVYQVLAQSDPRIQADVSKAPVSISFANEDIRYALKSLFKTINANYTLDQKVQGMITLTIKETPFRDALEQILKKSNTPLTWRMEDHVYVVEPKVTTPSR